MSWQPFLINLLSEKFSLTALCFAVPTAARGVPFKMGNQMKLEVHFNDRPGQPVYFTAREVDCLSLLVEGKTYREIAQILGLSRRTVEFYIANVKRKLNCQKKSELLRKLFNSNFLTLIKKRNER